MAMKQEGKKSEKSKVTDLERLENGGSRGLYPIARMEALQQVYIEEKE